MTPSKNTLYRIIFLNEDQIYEVYAKNVSESDMFSFIQIENLVFGKGATLVVDPAEERLKAEFSGVNRFYVPMHAIVRIDEVEKEGVAKVHEISQTTGNIRRLNPTIYSADPNDK